MSCGVGLGGFGQGEEGGLLWIEYCWEVVLVVWLCCLGNVWSIF